MPAKKSLDYKSIPIGLSPKMRIIKDVSKGNIISEEHVEKPINTLALQLRKDMLKKSI